MALDRRREFPGDVCNAEALANFRADNGLAVESHELWVVVDRPCDVTGVVRRLESALEVGELLRHGFHHADQPLGCECTHPDRHGGDIRAGVGKIDPHVEGHLVDAGLVRTIGGTEAIMHRARRRRENDEPSVLPDHVRGCEPAGDEAAANADIDHVADVERLFPELAGGREGIRHGACIVDQDVDTALLGDHPFDHRLDLFVVGMVAAHCNALAAGFRDFLRRRIDGAGHFGIALFLRSARDVDRAAMRTERSRDAAAGAAARPRYDGDWTFFRHS